MRRSIWLVARPESVFSRLAVELAPSRSAHSQRRSVTICNQCRSSAPRVHKARLASIAMQIRHNRQPYSPSRRTLSTSPIPTPEQRTTTPIREAPREALPSHAESQKWISTRRFNRWMDLVLARAATASHEINKYTGTDYSGIEQLRREIQAQEALVKQHHAATVQAKRAYDDAQAQQMKSQKEVVALLERKNSWADEDLERYMGLVRSEHVNEQAVLAAREALVAGEREVERARTRLEQRERARYHEEQIWSDTIRRNSTWITFGLMGFNALILLVNIGVVEPWRRRRMVGEIKSVVAGEGKAKEVDITDSQGSLAFGDMSAGHGAVTTTSSGLRSVTTVSTPETTLSIPAAGGTPPVELAPPTLVASGEDSIATLPVTEYGRIQRSWILVYDTVTDLFSKRTVSLRMRDITMLGIEGVVTGAGAVLLVLLTLRTR